MIYKEIEPHPDLADYIDAFWICEGAGKQCVSEIILPDNCVDLIFNLGEKCKTDNGEVTMYSGKTYLVGVMTTFKETFIDSSNKLVGVRFKPSAFRSFYRYVPLNEIKDITIEFDQALSPDIGKIKKQATAYLNEFFIRGLAKAKDNLFNVIKDIETAKGQINVEKLAKRNNVTTRQLERTFKMQIGISPKEFANVVRFRAALSKIKHNKSRQSLSAIAFECGYYDHAHLSNEIKKYTGVAPSKF